MGKMMSLLEKYKIVEKSPDNIVATSPEEPVTFDEQSIITENMEEDVHKMSTHLENETHIADLVTEENTTYNETKSNNDILTQKNTQAELYHTKQDISTIYQYAGLQDKAPTDTAFYLESLIHALPSELPDYVKKTTISNIITASNIDINKLLSDGMHRLQEIERFQSSFSETNADEIASLKQEIDKLTATITSYHQIIKQKEMLVEEESAIIEQEKDRLNHILSFFKAE